MAYRKRILCLANSRKHGGRCIAGREVIENNVADWIRPVSKRSNNAINDREMRYRNGGSASVADYIDISFLGRQPHDFQTENHLIDSSIKWSRAGKASWADLQTATDSVTDPIWRNGESTRYGLNDKIRESLANQLDSSLLLIKPDNLLIHVRDEPEYEGDGCERVVRAGFDCSGHSYKLKVTDPVELAKYEQMDEDKYPLDNALLCLSLTEIYRGFTFKVVAAILTPN